MVRRREGSTKGLVAVLFVDSGEGREDAISNFAGSVRGVIDVRVRESGGKQAEGVGFERGAGKLVKACRR